MGEEELRSILAEQGEISVHCHYCNTDYKFTAAETEALISRMRGEPETEVTNGRKGGKI